MEYEYEPAKIADDCPLFFVRTWGGADDQPSAPLPENVYDTRVDFKDSPLIIYGHSIVSMFEDDRPQQKITWERKKMFLSHCFSVVVPDGELGFTDAAEITEITREEFENAAERGWK